MTNDQQLLYRKIINDLFEYHDHVGARSKYETIESPLTDNGLSVLRDIEGMLMRNGPLYEPLFLNLLAVLAENEIGTIPYKAND